MRQERLYTESEVLGILMNLVNGIGLCAKGDIMPTRYKQKMTVNGSDHWVTGRSLKDLLEAYLELCIKEGTVAPGIVLKAQEVQETPFVCTYLTQFMDLYKTKQESLTKETRSRIIKNHIRPKFESARLSDLNLITMQSWFNDLEARGYSHETLLKIKNTFSPALDAAVEDGYLPKNPFKSSRFVVGGKETQHHKAIPPQKMLEVRGSIQDITDDRMRIMVALLSYTGMRFEEILGLSWDDIDFENDWIFIRKAVVHPKRNQPEVKDPKSKTSNRRIPLPEKVKCVLYPKFADGFLLSSASDKNRKNAMTYTEARNLFNKIRSKFNLVGYSAHDFRDTCATEWREAGVPTDVIAQLLGHSKSDITETRYVKYRDEIFQGVRAIMNNQNGSTL